MPIIDEEKLGKLLKSDFKDNLFIIFGEDDYLKDHYCDKIVSLTVKEDLRFFNMHTYNDDDTDLEEIFDVADTLPVMSDKICILVRNYPLHELGSEQFKSFEKKLAALPDTTRMIFFYNTLDVTYNYKKPTKWIGVIDLFAKYGQAVRLDHRTPAKTARMMITKAKDKGASIDSEEAMYLISCVGDDMQTLLNEFNKVCAYAAGEKITKKMIDDVAVKSVEATVFDISTSIFEGDNDRAFAILNELLRLKTEAQPIIGALASAYVNLYRYKLALNTDRSYTDFAESFGYKGNYSFSFSKLSSPVRSISLQGIRKAFDILAEADVITKSQKYDTGILLTETIAKLANCR